MGGNNESSNMKTTSKITTLLLAATVPCAAIAVFAGLAEPATFNSDIVLPLFAIAGLQLVALADDGRRQGIDLTAAPTTSARAALPRPCCGLRRHCVVA
jgi:hypothetical protein